MFDRGKLNGIFLASSIFGTYFFCMDLCAILEYLSYSSNLLPSDFYVIFPMNRAFTWAHFETSGENS
jgi:hypothetical protein